MIVVSVSASATPPIVAISSSGSTASQTRSPNITCSPLCASTCIKAAPESTFMRSENSTSTSRPTGPRAMSPPMPAPQRYGVTRQSTPCADADDARSARTRTANRSFIGRQKWTRSLDPYIAYRARRRCFQKPRRHLVPLISRAAEVVTVAVERLHVRSLERRVLVLVGEVRADVREVEIEVVLLGCRVDAVKVSEPLRRDQRIDRSRRDVDRAPFDGKPRRRERGVTYHRDAAAADHAFTDARCDLRQRRRVQEYLRRCAAVDVHLLIRLAVDFHVDERRRERAGNGGRREQDRP